MNIIDNVFGVVGTGLYGRAIKAEAEVRYVGR
jgi:hypothetical protein